MTPDGSSAASQNAAQTGHMSIKALLLLCFAALVLVGIGLILFRADQPAQPPTFRAATALAKGHVLSTGDVKLGEGQVYLKRDISRGGTIAPADLLELPTIATPVGTLAVAALLAPGQSLPNAGDKLWICPKIPAADAVGKSDGKAAAEENGKNKGKGKAADDGSIKMLARVCGGGACIALVPLPVDRAEMVAAAPHLAQIKPCRGG
ncbi:hypothetical protein [Polymorphobacter fuscus]|uniref:SAF domain-containing protein n=1 Tax=Sandarakinorhabdus fusca TaxID=1439888 RepID=A0A7C9LI19_9SPHN|nr:hypothetical protein [Polymorphobacter fuscus]KAB7643924.1 hypothetical protein F9290_15345 [Polymorphobacter fuscus]MQT18627.1 hypothetical protein [Polymorphobacter fuscus]NJC07005.1 hypothetical protein [Polymorphobacter fuscus]